MSFIQWIFCHVVTKALFYECKNEGKIFQREKLKSFSFQWILMVLLSCKDILCESHNAIHFQHLRCVYVHTDTISSPLGAADRFVWPGSLFCVSPSFSLSPHSCFLILSHSPVPKPDIKKGLPKNNVGNFLPPWELSPCWENSQTSLSRLPSQSISLCLSIAC